MKLFAHLNPLSIAPMIGHTDRHGRRFLRLLAPRATLYTEMIVAQAVVHGDPGHLLRASPEEHPLIAQLAGSDPKVLADATQIIGEFGYDAVNLNVGCPSERVKQGGFGACLMERPDEVRSIVRAMKATTSLPVTVKCRLGTDQVNGYAQLRNFIRGLEQAGADGVVVHARIANLAGFSTRYNLTVPALDWKMVERLQNDFPKFPITLNGGVTKPAQIVQVLSWIDRVMVGRVALQSPATLATMHAEAYHAFDPFLPIKIATTYREYIRENVAEGVPLHAMTRHMLNLFKGVPGARAFRRRLSIGGTQANAKVDVLDQALAHIVQVPTNHHATPILAA